VPLVCPLPKRKQPILCYVTDRRSLPLSTSADAHRLLLDSVGTAAAEDEARLPIRARQGFGRDLQT